MTVPLDGSPDRRRSGLPGALAAIFGVLSVMTAWVPVLALTTPLTTALALALGIVGVGRSRAGRPGAIVGVVAGGTALLMSAFFASCIGAWTSC